MVREVYNATDIIQCNVLLRQAFDDASLYSGMQHALSDVNTNMSAARKHKHGHTSTKMFIENLYSLPFKHHHKESNKQIKEHGYTNMYILHHFN